MSESKSRIITLEGGENYGIWGTRFEARASKIKGVGKLLQHGKHLAYILVDEAKHSHRQSLRLKQKTTPAKTPAKTEREGEESSDWGDWGASVPELSGETETEPILAEMSEDEMLDAAEKKASDLNKRLYTEIIETVNDAIATKLERRAKHDGLECMDLLKKWFEGKDITRVRKLKAQLTELDPANHSSFPDYMEEMMNLQQQLQTLDRPTDEDQLKLSIEKEIRVNYEQYKDILVELSLGCFDDLDLQDYVDKVEAHCIRIDAITNVTKQKKRIALQAGTQPRNNYKGNNFKSCKKCGKPGHDESECLKDHKCSTCGINGHTSKTCRSEKPTSGKGGKGRGRNPFSKECYNCGSEDHLKWECPKLNSKQLKKAHQAKLREEEEQQLKRRHHPHCSRHARLHSRRRRANTTVMMMMMPLVMTMEMAHLIVRNSCQERAQSDLAEWQPSSR